MQYQLVFPPINIDSTSNLPQKQSKNADQSAQTNNNEKNHNTSLKQIFEGKETNDKLNLSDFMEVPKTQQVINTENQIKFMVQKNFSYLYESIMKQQKKNLQTSNISELQLVSSIGVENMNQIRNQSLEKKTEIEESKLDLNKFQSQVNPPLQSKYSIYLQNDTFVQCKEDKQNKFIKKQQNQASSKIDISEKFTLKKKHSGEKCIIQFNNIAHSLKFQILNSSLKQCIAKKIVSPLTSIIEMVNFCCLRKDLNFVIQISATEKILTLKLLNGDLQRFVRTKNILKRKFWQISQIIVGEQQSIDFFLQSQSELRKLLKIELQSMKKPTQKALQMSCQKLIQYTGKILQNFQMRQDEYKNVDAKKIIKKRMYQQSGLFKLYEKFFKSQQEVTQLRKNKILTTCTIQKMFKYLQVDQIYQLIPKENQLPYEAAIRYLQKINFLKSPEQKIQCVYEYFKGIKNCCSEYHKNKYQLQTMDNILPVIIFTVLNSKLQNGFAHIKSLEHYIRLNAIKCDIESRIITNIYAAIQYITYTWEI